MSPRRARREPTVIVLRALGLGDLLTAVPAVRGLRRQYPELRLALAAPAVLAPLAALTDAVDVVVPVAGLEPLPGAVDGAQVAVNLHGRGPESTRLLVATRPRRLVAFAHPGVPASTGGPRWDPDEHEIDRWCRLVAADGAAPARTDIHLRPPAADPAEATDAGAVVIHPGAASPARRWPADRWARLAHDLVAAGEDVVLTCGPGERPLVEGIVAAVGSPGCRAAPAGPLLALAARVASARLLVCGDTGPAHLATAFATPSVVLFGPTSPHHWGPITGGPHGVLWAGTTGDPHGHAPDAGLLAITVQDVRRAVAERLAAIGADRPEGQRRERTAGDGDLDDRPLQRSGKGIGGGPTGVPAFSRPASCSADVGWRR